MRLWAIAFATGILSVQQLSSLPMIYWSATGLVVIIGLKPFQKFLPKAWLAVLVSGLAFGFAWALLHAHWMMNQRLLPQYEGVDIVLEGQVISLPQSSSSFFTNRTSPNHASFNQEVVRFGFRPAKILSSSPILANISLAKFPKRISLSWYNPRVKIKAGQFWRFSVRLKRPFALMNPGGFDYESWMFQQRIQAKGTVRNSDASQRLNRDAYRGGITGLVLEFRQLILDKLSNEVNIGEHSGFIRNVTQALVLGYRAGLDASEWQIFQRTGTIHLMAISGLHIGLIAMLIYGVVGLLWRFSGRGCLFMPAPQIAAIAALLAATVYAMLAGFTIPTQRALVMLSVAMFHIVFKRTPLPASKTIALALVLVLLLDPLAVLAQGFWLSFLAVGLIIYLIQPKNARTGSTALDEYGLDKMTGLKSQSGVVFKNIGLTILKAGRIQWALTVAMFPTVLYFYQSSSIVSPLANFIAIPVMSLAVVPLMFLATALLFINVTIANWVFSMVDFIYSLLWQFLEGLSLWRYATLDLSIVSLWGLVLCYLAIVLWLCVKGAPMRGLALVLILPVMFYRSPEIKQGEAVVTVLDVGQGLSTVVQTKEHTLVFDTGPRFSDNFDTGRAVVIPYLRHIGRSHIDTLVMSHGDNDHSGGFNSIAAILPIKRVLTSIPDAKMFHSAKTQEYETLACHVGQEWQYDGVGFSMLSPMEIIATQNGHDENNQSCVLKVTTAYGRVLITADIERETESYLYHAMPEKLAAEILIVPHHGSQTSSLAGFIQAVAPRYAVFTVGYKNRYHHPNQNIVRRYRNLSTAQLLRSNETGALIFNLQHDIPLHAHSYRAQAKRYWHAVDVAAF